MAAVAAERSHHKRPFAAWVKRLTNLHPSSKKSKKAEQLKKDKENNPYLQSTRPDHPNPSDSTSSDDPSLTAQRHAAQQSPSRRSSVDPSCPPANSNRSQAPTVATNPETIHSDAGFFKSSTGGGAALSSVDGAGRDSTFSSPSHSQQSLATTLTTIQSTNAHSANNQPHAHFPAQPVSAVPPHLAQPANSTHADNASIMTLASSSKRRRRSMDTDASVRAIPPRSMWGDSRESLPLSVLSSNIDHPSSRTPVGPLINAERASIYSSQGVSAPVIAPDRNSYYAASHRQTTKDRDGHKDFADARSINFDTKSINYDGKSFVGTDGASLKGYEGSIRSGALSHGRNDSIPSGTASPLISSPLLRRPSGALTLNSVKDKDDANSSSDHKDHS